MSGYTTNGDWPLLIAQHHWNRSVVLAERLLKECLKSPKASPGTYDRARALLAKVPAERKRQEERARVAAAVVGGILSGGLHVNADTYTDNVYKAGHAYGIEREQARKRLGWE